MSRRALPADVVEVLLTAVEHLDDADASMAPSSRRDGTQQTLRMLADWFVAYPLMHALAWEHIKETIE